MTRQADGSDTEAVRSSVTPWSANDVTAKGTADPSTLIGDYGGVSGTSSSVERDAPTRGRGDLPQAKVGWTALTYRHRWLLRPSQGRVVMRLKISHRNKLTRCHGVHFDARPQAPPMSASSHTAWIARHILGAA